MRKKLRKLRKKNKKEILLSEIIEKEIKDNSLRQSFSKEIINFSKEVSKKKPQEHSDFTSVPFVTIDGEDSRDFDDAVWSDKLENGTVKVMIAISDVSFFVSENDPLDLEARKRGNSFYFPDRVIPMFPEELSNNICSLVPNKNRLCLIIEANLRSNGEITKKKIHRGIIKSQARLSYKEVEDIIKKKKKHKNSIQINNLFDTYKILQSSSLNRGKISFETNEYQIKIDNDKKFKFEKKVSLDSYKIIEEFMILANKIIAELLIKRKIQTIFRNHDKPSKEKINNLKKILKENNIFLKKNFVSQKDYNVLIKNAGKSGYTYIHNILLKSQSKAYYENKNRGHFGLALENYTHFTSPIRRYSDLIVHRSLIKNYFLKKTNIELIPQIGGYLTDQEKKSDLLERNITERACSLYLRNISKYKFFGIIDAIESFGIFIKSVDLPFSGMARINQKVKSNLKNKKNTFKIGQLVSFRIKRNNIYSGKILVDKLRLVEDFYEKKQK